MAASNSSNLPPGWVMKSSRRCPTASYYFNTETGRSTWIHPKLLEWADQKKQKEEEEGTMKKKNKKKKKKKKVEVEEEKMKKDDLKEEEEEEEEEKRKKKIKTQEPAYVLRKKDSPKIYSEENSSPNKKNQSEDSSLNKSQDALEEKGINSEERSPIKFAFKPKEIIKPSSSVNSKSSAVVGSRLIGSKFIGPHLSFMKRTGAKNRIKLDGDDSDDDDGDDDMQSPKVDVSSSTGLKLISQSYKEENKSEENKPDVKTGRKKKKAKRRSKKMREKDREDLIEKIIKEINEESEKAKKNENAGKTAESLADSSQSSVPENRIPKRIARGLHSNFESGGKGLLPRNVQLRKSLTGSGFESEKESSTPMNIESARNQAYRSLESEKNQAHTSFGSDRNQSPLPTNIESDKPRTRADFESDRRRIHRGFETDRDKSVASENLESGENQTHAHLKPERKQSSTSQRIEHDGKQGSDTKRLESERGESASVHTGRTDEVIKMEIEDWEIVTEIANYRGSVTHARLEENPSLPSTSFSIRRDVVYFVVDTNVLIHDVTLLETLKVNRIEGREVVVVIPYIALQELDGLKKSYIGKACQVAICWVHRHFEDGDTRVQGQSYDSYLTTLAENKNACGDDLIRDYCLHLQKLGLDVCLLSNDVNLCNKAFMANISAIGSKKLSTKLATERQGLANTPAPLIPTKRLLSLDEDCPMKQLNELTDSTSTEYQTQSFSTPSTLYDDSRIHLDKRNQSVSDQDLTPQVKRKRTRKKSSSLTLKDDQLYQKIVTSLKDTLSSILKSRMMEVYEELWLVIVKHKPPWTLEEILSCWQKHWLAVMIDKFPSEVETILQHIQKNLANSGRGNYQVSVLLKQVTHLYMYFEDKYQSLITPIHCIHSTDKPVGDSQGVDRIVENSGGMDKRVENSGGMGERVEDSGRNTPSTPPPSTPATSIDNGNLSDQPLPPSTDNVKNMIFHVGVYITHFVALVLDANGVTHNLPKLNPDIQMNQEEAYVSGINLHKVTLNLGNTIVRCVSERTQDSLLELCHLLVNFWAEAKEPCPNLPFTDTDLATLISSHQGQQFMASVLTDLERLINLLLPVIKVPL